MNDREIRIKKFGIDIILEDEKEWREKGYSINPNTGLLEQINKTLTK